MIAQLIRGCSYWIADKITGGALTWRQDALDVTEEMRVKWRDRAFERSRQISDKNAQLETDMKILVRLATALHRIAALETPNAAPAAKRMAAVAREALK